MAETPVAAPAKKKISQRIIGEAGVRGKADATASRDRSAADLISQQATLAGRTDFSENDSLSKDENRDARLAHDAQTQSAQQAVANSQSNIARQNSVLAGSGEEFVKKKMTKDVLEGARFGEAVLGDEGLGRSTDSADVNQSMDQLREQSLGFSGAESTARREQAIGNIGTATQGQQRALQSQLARSGVRGGAAGKQIAGVAIGGIQAQAQAEQQLFIQGEDAKRAGTGAFAKAAGAQSSFDLGQAAKEKAIVLQSGLGFAQMGAAERGAKLQADASVAAAAAKSNANSGGGTVVCTELHRQGLLSTEVWKKNTSFGKSMLASDPYMFRGYLLWGVPMAYLLRNSSTITKLTLPFFKKVAFYMAGDKSVGNTSAFFVAMSLNTICKQFLKVKDFIKGKEKRTV